MDRSERLRKPLTVADADAIKAQASSVEDLAVAAPNIGYSGGPFDDNINYQGLVPVPSLRNDFSHPICKIAGADGVSAISAALPVTQ